MDLSLLVASADSELRGTVSAAAASVGLRVLFAEGGSEALARINNESVDLLVLDHPLPDCDASHLLTTARRRRPDLWAMAIVHSDARGEHDRLMRGDVDEIIESPSNVKELSRRLLALAERVVTDRSFNILGSSPPVRELRETIRLIGPTTATVLITGESGVGKELVARAIHSSSRRSRGPFVVVHAAALAQGVLESELFGHERGAFTGADTMRPGKFEAASAGTLFLDEIGEIDLATQVKLLRLLEEQRFTRVGGNSEVETHARVVAATNRALAHEVENGNFRRDLYYRLKIVEVSVPSLRARATDIPALWEHFTKSAAEKNGVHYGGTNRSTLTLLANYSWPGNVRELRNAAERAVLMAQGQAVRAEHLPEDLAPRPKANPNLPVPVDSYSETLEREVLYKTLLALRAEIAEVKTILLQMQSSAQGSAGLSLSPEITPNVVSPRPMEPIPRAEGHPVVMPDEENYTSLDEMERELITRALFDFDGNRKKVAKALGISERTLYRKLRELEG